MFARVIILFCCLTGIAHGDKTKVEVEPGNDRPSWRVAVSQTAVITCCYNASGGFVNATWVNHIKENGTMTKRYVDMADYRAGNENFTEDGKQCQRLTLESVTLNDTGLYQCILTHPDLRSPVFTYGTFLQVYKPMVKYLNLSEKTKNKILTAEGILLLLCVLLPGILLLRKTKQLNQLEKRRNKEEEENIYEGLNLEDCSSTYHQIQRSEVRGPYQDVDNVREEDIQLEKP
ncbi:B-cell antigen receptor complex-associated protein alpha chain [Megalops cyprinoides]|uniref:B-cell antigen receptor complex-associated protein alpha chain n=1 Tax=Megalops cyprinoides TaxID=118141 RepID=UPI001863A1B6|nr:B-cell antigen receptor complex-associated protein alpha chain [Megalops cyprinoides]